MYMAKNDDKIVDTEPKLTPAQELEAVKAQLRAAEMKLASAGITKDLEPMVLDKVRAGLSREQAFECARRQALYDKAWTDSVKEKDPAVAKEILTTGVREALRTTS